MQCINTASEIIPKIKAKETPTAYYTVKNDAKADHSVNRNTEVHVGIVHQ